MKIYRTHLKKKKKETIIKIIIKLFKSINYLNHILVALLYI